MFSNRYLPDSVSKTIAFVVLSGSIGLPQAHAAFTPVERNSLVAASALVCGMTCYTEGPPATPLINEKSSTDFGPFVQSASAILWPGSELTAIASQNSSIGPNGFSASMSTKTGWSNTAMYAFSKAQSVFELTFSLDEAMQFTFAANGSNNGLATGCGAGFGFPLGISISLTGAGGSILPSAGCGEVSMAQSGVLEAGTYTFAMSMFGQDGLDFDVDASFQLTPVPVPAAAWLMGSGLVGLAGVARRRGASKTV